MKSMHFTPVVKIFAIGKLYFCTLPAFCENIKFHGLENANIPYSAQISRRNIGGLASMLTMSLSNKIGDSAELINFSWEENILKFKRDLFYSLTYLIHLI